MPTTQELAVIESQVPKSWILPSSSVGRSGNVDSTQQTILEVCGFGPIISAARTSMLLSKWEPSRVILFGIAGGLSDKLTIGSAHVFDEVACYGIGAGAGDEYQTATELGWSKWQIESARLEDTQMQKIEELIHIRSLQQECDPSNLDIVRLLLLTTTTASAHFRDAENKLKKFPNAIAEDMEGFSVAVACHLHSIPLDIIRGISNRAGDRNHANWNVRQAMISAFALVRERCEE